MADSQTPTEDQVKAANEAEAAKWEGDFKDEDLEVPYKPATEEKKDKEDQAEELEKGEETDEEEVATLPVAEVPSLLTAEDPGVYTPADYSFEVTLADGKTHKITTVEEAEKLAEDPDNFETPKQLMDFIHKSTRMQRNLDRDHDQWEADKKTFDDQLEAEKERQTVIGTLTNGFEYLISKGLMPPIDPADAIADWSNPEVAKHAGVKEQIALINYMTKENETREKAGIPVLASALDAFNAWQLDSGRKQAEKERKAAGEARKKAGAKVAGVSPSQQGSFVPKGIAVGNPNALKRNASIWDD